MKAAGSAFIKLQCAEFCFKFPACGNAVIAFQLKGTLEVISIIAFMSIKN